MKTYRFGVIGCGRISKNHMESIKVLPGARLAAVCDSNEEALIKASQKYDCKSYKDYQELLADSNIDIVNICTESGLHARIALDAIKAGKHVLVEKPMAMSLAEADRMIAASRKFGVKLGVVHQNRFNKVIAKLRKAVEYERFGKLTHASAVVRWNRNDEYYSQAPWRGTWAQDGGCLMNQSIHNIDLLQWMMGPVKSLFAYTATNLRKIEGEDVGVIVLKFQNGGLGVIEATTTIYPKNLEETLCIFGSTGSVCIGGIAVNKIESWRVAGDNETEIIEDQDAEPPNVYGFGHADIIKDFINAIEENREPAVSGEEGRKALEIILAIYHSVKLNKEIKFPLEEKFTIGIGL